MRSSFGADWAFGIRGAIEDTVRRAFPSELRQWPVLQSFNFESYSIGDGNFVMVLRDKLSGVPTGPGVPQPFPYTDHPPLPPSSENVAQWLSYLTRKFELRSEDIAMILPIHDSHRSDAAADFDLFSPEERQLWSHQLNVGIAHQMAGLKVSPQSSSSSPVNITYNVSGANARVNVNSSDASTNIASTVPVELFQQMLSAIRAAGESHANRAHIERSIQDMEAAYGTNRFAASYTTFMAVLADHIQVFGPIVAPYLPILAKLVT